MRCGRRSKRFYRTIFGTRYWECCGPKTKMTPSTFRFMVDISVGFGEIFFKHRPERKSKTVHSSVSFWVGFSPKTTKWSRPSKHWVYICSYQGCETTRKMARSVSRFFCQNVSVGSGRFFGVSIHKYIGFGTGKETSDRKKIESVSGFGRFLATGKKNRT